MIQLWQCIYLENRRHWSYNKLSESLAAEACKTLSTRIDLVDKQQVKKLFLLITQRFVLAFSAVFSCRLIEIYSKAGNMTKFN